MTTYPNNSGVKPVEYKILVKPDEIEQKTAGGIIKPEKVHEMEQWAQVKGTLVAKGGAAFGEPFTDEERSRLVPGARIYYRKYEGILIYGADGEEYRLCSDKDVGGLIDNEASVAPVKARSRAGLDAA